MIIIVTMIIIMMMIMTLNVAPDKGRPGVLLELAPTVLERYSSGEYADAIRYRVFF